MKSNIWIASGLLVVLTGAGCGGGNSNDDPAPPPNLEPEAPSGPVLPDDPGDAGRATVAGIDSDNDRVRDDLQRFIVQEYADSKTIQDALKQVAIALQAQLQGSGSKEIAMRSAQQTMRAVECVYSIEQGWNDQGKADALVELQARALNTEERLDAYAVFDELLWGEVIVSLPVNQHASSCED